MSRTLAILLVGVAVACSPAPEPKATAATDPPASSGEARKPDAPDASGEPDASAPDAGDAGPDAGDAGPEPVYEAPPPLVVRRHHVFASLAARAGKRVTLTSLLSTASDEHPDIGAGTEATLQHKAKGKQEWKDVATVKVVWVTAKRDRLGGSQQEIALELLDEVAGNKAAFVRGAQLRLQVDRPEQPGK